MTEIWVDIIDYESFYQISDHGNVRSKDRTVSCSRLGSKRLKGRPLKTTIDSNGYARVTLQDQDRKAVWKVHRLVALHFLPKTDGKDFVNHIDNVRHNNCIGNLEWCTARENTQHMHAQGRNYSESGQSNTACKLTDEDVGRIRGLKGFMSQAKIAAMFGVSPSHVHRLHHNLVRNC